MLQEGIHAVTSSSPELATIIESLVLIHASCIIHDHTVAAFIPPLSHQEMAQNWSDVVRQTADDKNGRIILVYISKVAHRSLRVEPEHVSPVLPSHPWPTLKIDTNAPSSSDLEVAGCISLSLPHSQTGPFRGLVQRLFVSPFHRRKRIATLLVAELEKQAMKLNRWSLMLDTTVGTPAEDLYLKLGYEKLGVVREYGIHPDNGGLVDEVFFWKDLRKGVLEV